MSGHHGGGTEVAIDLLDTVNIDTDDGFVALAPLSAAGVALSTLLGDDEVLEGEVDVAFLRNGDHDSQGTVNGGGSLDGIVSDDGKFDSGVRSDVLIEGFSSHNSSVPWRI